MPPDEPSPSPPPPYELAETDFDPTYQWKPSRDAYLLCGLLFGLTCLSTFVAGVLIAGPPPTAFSWDVVWNGLSYSGPLMLILLCHEMGHYLQARRHHVPATLPFFIPLPPLIGLFGTMGAVIVQAGGVANRRALFDIAVSGPLAGIVIALPVAWYGVQQSVIIPADARGDSFGDPLVLKAMVYLKHGTLPPDHDVLINPLLFAGWVGIFLTGLNLLPVGQLDGGHIMYTLLGKRAHTVALITWASLITYIVWTQYWPFVLIAVLLYMMGLKHPPTSNDQMSLGVGRTVVGWVTMFLLILCFIPQPLQFGERQPPVRTPVDAVEQPMPE